MLPTQSLPPSTLEPSAQVDGLGFCTSRRVWIQGLHANLQDATGRCYFLEGFRPSVTARVLRRSQHLSPGQSQPTNFPGSDTPSTMIVCSHHNSPQSCPPAPLPRLELAGRLLRLKPTVPRARAGHVKMRWFPSTLLAVLPMSVKDFEKEDQPEVSKVEYMSLEHEAWDWYYRAMVPRFDYNMPMSYSQHLRS